MSKIEITGEQYSVGELFSERFAFFVPPYQRMYAWTTEHAGELLDDLLGYLDGDADAIDDLNPYFLGSIVLIKGSRPEAQIVDGQQRLITLTILLAVLRALVPSHFAESITRRLYEPADPLNEIPARYRLMPKERDTQFFQEFIQGEGGVQRLRAQMHTGLSDSQRNVYENAVYYLKHITALPEAQRIRLAQFIIQRCLLVAISTPDLNAAYRIFSVLNDRGLDLSPSDILKAEVIGQIASHAQQEYTARWESTEESLGREGFNELLSHIRAINVKAHSQQNLIDDLRHVVLSNTGGSERFIDDVLVPLGSAYYVLSNATYEYPGANDRINILLRWLGRIDNSDWVPPALVYLARYHDQPDRLLRFFTELERLAASLMIRRQYRHRRIPRYARLISAIERGDDLAHPSSPIQLTSEEREATIGEISGEIYLMQATPRNYVMQRLDSSLAGTEALYTFKTLSIEHVLPRNPAAQSEWLAWFPSLEERATWVHRLGNLALLSREKNRQASNYNFAYKKDVYFTGRSGVSPFALTTQVLRESEWTPQVVQRRQRELIAHLRQLWRL